MPYILVDKLLMMQLTQMSREVEKMHLISCQIPNNRRKLIIFCVPKLNFILKPSSCCMPEREGLVIEFAPWQILIMMPD